MQSILSVAEVAQRINQSETTVRRMCREGSIPGVSRLGNIWAIPESSLSQVVTRPRGWQPGKSRKTNKPAK